MLYKISFVLLTMIPLTMFQDSYWYNDASNGDWEVSNTLQRYSPYYSSYRYIASQMAAYGPATHVGKINRGELRHPSLNMPRDRAYGKNSDFYREDARGNCQWTLATWADVNLGFAKCPGDKFCLPAGLEVLSDSSLVVETKNRFPCRPNPCSKYKITTCKPYKSFKAQCVPKRGDWEMSIKWKDIDDHYDQASNSDLHLEAAVFLRSDPSDDFDTYGTDYYDEVMNYDDDPAYGVIPGDDEDISYNYDTEDEYYFGEETLTFTTTPDGTNYTQYNYMIQAYGDNTWDPLDYSEAVLTVKYEGQVVRVIHIPQDVGLGDPAPDYHDTYVFGCFRNTPDGYYLDTSKAGFFDYEDNPDFYNFCNFDQCTTSYHTCTMIVDCK